MNLTLNEEQRYLKDTARNFFQGNAPVAELRKLRDSQDERGYSPELWRQIVDLGWSGMIFPETVNGVETGGLGFGFTGLGVVLQESGHTLTASPLLSSVVLGGSAILLGGSDAQLQAYLPELISGEVRYALALEETAHHDPAACAMPATPTGHGYQLTGSKTFVLDGHTAERLVVVARTAGSAGERAGLSLFLVDADTAGITRTRTPMVDSRAAADIHFDAVEVTREQLLGTLDEGFGLLEQVLDRGRICLAAEMLGGTRELFERTLTHLKERRQFGVPIGSFQALQHRMATVFTEIELAKSTVLAALSALDEDSAKVPLLASLAKHKVCAVYELMSNEAVQLHGGIGVTDAMDIGLFLKRARVAQQTFGDSAFHRKRFASLSGY
ncbi:MAG: acyl-CoA dehydrogenase family protein [Halioglobus sp.]|nr:acyl-CoA dehydrogenase family protein [Halioglobus sp.]